MGLFDRFRRERPRPESPAPETERRPVHGSEFDPTLGSDEPGAEEATVFVPRAVPKVVGVLVAVSGELENEVFAIHDGPNKLGRATDCQVVLPSQRISREHALLSHSEGRFTIRPLSERNPTRVNGEATTGAPLEDGDEIRLGHTTFRFRTVW